MTKKSKKKVESDEKKIIKQLIKNSNESINKIAEKCSFSRQKVWRIIKNLEKNNTIWGYTAVVDQEKQGLNSFMLLIKRGGPSVPRDKVKEITNRTLDDIAEKNNIFIESSFYLNGNYDWVICFTAVDLKKAKKFAEIFIKMYQGHVVEVNLLEKIFPAKKCGIVNPEIEKLTEYIGL